MKNRNLFNISRRALAILLCLCMAFTALALVSCNSDVPEGEEAPKASDEVAEVLRLVQNVKAGNKITEEDIEVVSLRTVDIHIGALKNKEDVIGKYAVSDLYKGDFITSAKISEDIKAAQGSIGLDAEFDIDQILISDYASLVKNGDYTEAIKTAIKENPGKTIYFADGEYTISDTIVIAADATTAVSLRLANYATIKAASNWASKNTPMIRIGVKSEAENNDIFNRRNTYIMGGIVDASDVATGISLEGGKDILLSNITIKNAYLGLYIKKADNDLGATYADIENVNVVGNSEEGSIGVLLEGTYNNLTNMKISHVQYAVKCGKTGDNNVFKSIMAIGTGTPADVEVAGFYDLSGGNHYDMCYSDQFATGFLIGERARSVYNACVASWWSADNNYHVGFRTVDDSDNPGYLNSTILYSKVYHTDTVETDAYILAMEGGEGSVQYPFNQVVSDTYKAILDAYCTTDILG